MKMSNRNYIKILTLIHILFWISIPFIKQKVQSCNNALREIVSYETHFVTVKNKLQVCSYIPI